MKRLILTSLCVILLHALPLYSVPIPVDVNFEQLPLGMTGMNYTSGNPIPGPSQLYNQLSSLDILFTSGNPYVALVELGPGHATSGKNGIGGSTPEGGLLTYSQSITVSFFDNGNISAPLTTDFVSIRGDNYTTSGYPVYLNAYDLNGNFIVSDTKVDIGNVGVALELTVLAPGIHSVQFFGTDGGWGSVAFDDLIFNTPVPEPATIALLGFGALSLLRRKRSV
jgi:hypothetical protein